MVKMLGSLVKIVKLVFFELKIVAHEHNVKTKVANMICTMYLFIISGSIQCFVQLSHLPTIPCELKLNLYLIFDDKY